MWNRIAWMVAAGLVVAACAAPYDPLQDYEALEAATIVESPPAEAGSFAPANEEQVARGKYLVELLGCGVCHTNGALEGAPDRTKLLAGSRIGIAYTNPLEHRNPGVVYPPNLTPDTETGIGSRSDVEIANAIRSGVGQHGGRPITVMPWQGYSRMTEDDVLAMVSYLRSIKPVRHEVPAAVPPGRRASEPFVHFGVYRKN